MILLEAKNSKLFTGQSGRGSFHNKKKWSRAYSNWIASYLWKSRLIGHLNISKSFYYILIFLLNDFVGNIFNWLDNDFCFISSTLVLSLLYMIWICSNNMFLILPNQTSRRNLVLWSEMSFSTLIKWINELLILFAEYL